MLVISVLEIKLFSITFVSDEFSYIISLLFKTSSHNNIIFGDIIFVNKFNNNNECIFA